MSSNPYYSRTRGIRMIARFALLAVIAGVVGVGAVLFVVIEHLITWGRYEQTTTP